jgi:sporulation protein YqfC
MKRSAEKAEQLLDLPSGVLTAGTRMELYGGCRVLIEDCRGIVKYDEDCIQLKTVEGIVRFLGCELCIASLHPACATITGKLTAIEFLGESSC